MSLVRFRPEAPYNADLAHLVERNLAKVEVAGSSPVIRSKKRRTDLVSVLLFLERLNRAALKCQNILKKSPSIRIANAAKFCVANFL